MIVVKHVLRDVGRLAEEQLLVTTTEQPVQEEVNMLKVS